MADATPRSLYSAGLRFSESDPVPSELIGKTPREIVDLYEQVRRIALQNAQTQPQAPQQQATPAATEVDSDLLYSNPAEFQRRMQTSIMEGVQNYVHQMAAPMVAGLDSSAKAMSQNGRFKDTWSRWGAEIEREISAVPQHMRSREVYDRAAALVKSNHLDEILAEAAQAQPKTAAATEPSGSVAGQPSGAPATDPVTELFAENGAWVQELRKQGMRESDVRAYLRNTGKDPAAYVKSARNFAPGNILFQNPDGSQTYA